MSENLSFCCSGRFPFVPFFDLSLSEEFRISTSSPRSLLHNYRVVQVPFSDSSRRVIAVSGYDSPHAVVVYDVTSKHQICHCLGHKCEIVCLASLSSETLSSNPIIVSGGSSDSQILIFDALNATKLGRLQETPDFPLRFLHVPEWNQRDVFVGAVGFCRRYDVTTQQKIGVYEVRAAAGLSAVVSQNLLISADWDRGVRLWSRDDYECQNTFRLAEWAMSCCCVEEKNLIVVGLRNGIVEVFDIRRSEKRIHWIDVSGNEVYTTVQIDQNRCVCGSSDGLVTIFDPETGQCSAKTELPNHVFGVCALKDAPREIPMEQTDEIDRVAFLIESTLLRRRENDSSTISLRIGCQLEELWMFLWESKENRN